MRTVAGPVIPAARAAGLAVMASLTGPRRPVAAVRAVLVMLPPGAAAAPIVQILATQRIAVAIAVEEPHAVARIIIIIVPAAAEADLREAAAVIGGVVAVIAIAVVIGIAVAVVIIGAIARRAVAPRGIAAAVDVAIIAAAERRRRERAERDGERAPEILRHGLVLLEATNAASHLECQIARVELNLR